jgi:hypothetical protein
LRIVVNDPVGNLFPVPAASGAEAFGIVMADQFTGAWYGHFFFTAKRMPCEIVQFFGHWSLVIGHWSLVTGHWSLVIGHWSLVFGHWSLVIG